MSATVRIAIKSSPGRSVPPHIEVSVNGSRESPTDPEERLYLREYEPDRKPDLDPPTQKADATIEARQWRRSIRAMKYAGADDDATYTVEIYGIENSVDTSGSADADELVTKLADKIQNDALIGAQIDVDRDLATDLITLTEREGGQGGFDVTIVADPGGQLTRTEVQVYDLVPSTAEQAAQLGF